MERTTLVVQVGVVAADSSRARQLGWTVVPPGTEVTATREGDIGGRFTTVTDSTGAATFDTLLSGTYDISALRILGPGETALLDPADADVNAFSGASRDSVAGSRDTVLVSLASGRRGSLVIAEVTIYSLYYGAGGTGGTYDFGGYIELYNNADTTVYLDSLMIGGLYPTRADFTTEPCAHTEPFRNDSLGAWAEWFYQFPGTGHRYPLSPGRTVVVATDAIDHSKVITNGLDLSFADFEFAGPQDADNPTVPNVRNRSPRGDFFEGHGLFYGPSEPTPYIARPFDPLTLPVMVDSFNGVKWYRIPRDLLLDVATFEYDVPRQFPYCDVLVYPGIDAQPARQIHDADLRSEHRKVMAYLPDGRAILLRTKNSAQDFHAADRTPGRIVP